MHAPVCILSCLNPLSDNSHLKFIVENVLMLSVAEQSALHHSRFIEAIESSRNFGTANTTPSFLAFLALACFKYCMAFLFVMSYLLAVYQLSFLNYFCTY